MILRYYQEEAVVSIFNYFATNQGNPIVALPTGTGKSYVIAEFLRRALHYYPQTRFLVLTHVKELIAQNFAELVNIWPTAPAGIYSAGLKRRDTHQPITFCGIASVKDKASNFGRVDIVLIDECHMLSDKATTMYAQVIAQLKAVNPMLKVVGLTATPFRQGVGHLTEGKLFTDVCCDYCSLDGFNKLVDEGYISPLIPKRTETELDVEGVGITKGEFNIDELQAAVDKDSVTRAALGEAVRLARGRWSWLVFCTGTTHADHACQILNELGIPALCVHSKLKGGDKERDANLARFKRMEVGALCGVGVFTTGFNHRPVDCIVMLRPTMSSALWVQMLGRGTRPSPETHKKNCLVLDFAANTRRLGPINDPVLPRKKGKRGGAWVPYKICPHCSTYCHTRVRFCPECQGEFPQTFAGTTTASSEELIRREKKKEPEPEPDNFGVEVFDVRRAEFTKHWSRDTSKPPSMRVTYYCTNGQTFNEWLCFEHKGFALHKAKEAWRQMADAGAIEHPDDTPATVDEALSQVGDIRPPSRIRVLLKPKFSEVVGYDFSTTGEPVSQGVNDDGADIPF